MKLEEIKDIVGEREYKEILRYSEFKLPYEVQRSILNALMGILIALITYTFFGSYIFVTWVSYAISVVLLLNAFSWYHKFKTYTPPVNESWERLKCVMEQG